MLLIATVVFLTRSGGSGTGRPGTTTSAVHSTVGAHRGATRPPSIEAGVEPWQLTAPLSREGLVTNGAGLTVLGGLSAAGSSFDGVYTIDIATGAVTGAGTLRDPVHDAGAAVLGKSAFVFGGGSPATVGTVQSIAQPTIPPARGATGAVTGSLPAPRSDLAVATISAGGRHRSTTVYIVGGYDGTNAQPAVLATTDGVHFETVATLRVPVRYPAVAAYGNDIYVFGGQTVSTGATAAATNDIQRVDPARHATTVVGHLPQAEYAATATVLDGTLYVAGGQVPNGATLTGIYAFVPETGAVLDAGLLPQAEAFGGYATVGSGSKAITYIVGGEVAAQSGRDQAGIPSGTLQTVLTLRPSHFGGPAGPRNAGAPFTGTLLIADRGNDRLVAMGPDRSITWQYPSATMPPPAGGLYFPDDAFFIHHGTGIISNQEDHHTIVEIGYPSGKILWQYGHPGVSGASPGFLNQPDDAYLLKNGTVTVADASNNRILFISPQGQVIGQIGNRADAHVLGTSIAYPNGDTPLADGNVLVSEINGSYIDEYAPSGKAVWSVRMPSVNYPSDPQQLGPNLYLMTDYNPPAEGRVLEFDRTGHIVWEYDALVGDGMLKMPSSAARLPNGLIMVNDDYRHRVVVIDPTTDEIVWQYGLTGAAGTSIGMLNIPDGFDLLLPGGVTPTHPATG